MNIDFEEELSCQKEHFMQPITSSMLDEMGEMIKRCIDENVRDPSKTIIFDSIPMLGGFINE